MIPPSTTIEYLCISMHTKSIYLYLTEMHKSAFPAEVIIIHPYTSIPTPTSYSHRDPGRYRLNNHTPKQPDAKTTGHVINFAIEFLRAITPGKL